MDRIQLLIFCVALLLLVMVLELVRRRRLLERYALLWLLSSLVLLGLAIWRDALNRIAEQLGVAYPPNALFIVAFGFVLWLLLHFSVAVSRLNDQSKILAQRHALLEERLRRVEQATAEDTVAPANGRSGEPRRTLARVGVHEPDAPVDDPAAR
jgi:hypothetical protein